jgi:hypothetical protein
MPRHQHARFSGRKQMARYRSTRRQPVPGVGHRRARPSGYRAAAKSSPLGSSVSSSPRWRSARQADPTTANCLPPAGPTRPRPDGTYGLFARHPFRVRRAVVRSLSLGEQYLWFRLGASNVLRQLNRACCFGAKRRWRRHWVAQLVGGNTEPRRGVGEAAAVHVRRDKAALFQWVQAPPGDRSCRKQLGQAWR